MIPRYLLIMASALVAFLVTPPAHADRVKDLASLAAARSNQLVGFGIVVGCLVLMIIQTIAHAFTM